MTYRDALLDELEELKCLKALKIFQKILKFDENQQKSFEKKNNRKLLEKIFNALKEIEWKNENEEIEEFLELIREINDINNEFDWLIELLLVHSSQLVIEYELENTKIDAIVKFLHGSSAIERLFWYRASVLLLESAFQIASQHEEWTLNNERLCVLISHKLSDSLTKLSRQVRNDEGNVEGALKLSKRSLNVLRKFISKKNLNFEIEAEFEFAACHFDNKSYKNALNHFNHALILAEAGNLKQKSCEILVNISECHKRLDDFKKFENYLLLARELADDLKLFDFKGDINLKLGEFCTDDFDKMSSHLKAAIECYKKAENSNKLNSTKLILAETKAKENFNALVDTILRCDKSIMGQNRDYEKLVLWYDRKYPLTNRHHEFYRIEEDDPNDFIKKFYDPDEIIKIKQ